MIWIKNKTCFHSNGTAISQFTQQEALVKITLEILMMKTLLVCARNLLKELAVNNIIRSSSVIAHVASRVKFLSY